MTGDGKKAPVRSYITELATGKRSVRFMIRMTLEERARLEDMAKQAGLNLSALMRHLLTIGPARRFRKKRKTADSDSDPPSSGAVK